MAVFARVVGLGFGLETLKEGGGPRPYTDWAEWPYPNGPVWMT